ncbi:MAG: DNA polymerase [Thermovirgaceae bacterium]
MSILNENLVLLIDGHGLAYRAFYALPELNAPDGSPTQAILGFVNMLLKTLDENDPLRVGVVFDAAGPTFRHEAFKEYKENRQPIPETLMEQLPAIKDISAAMGFTVYEREGVEADDVIAASAKKAKENGYDVLVLTADKDMFQLLDEGVRVMRPVKGVSTFKMYDRKRFTDEYGFKPEAMADYLALVGDNADNIPGVRGIGDKTAKALLSSYGNLEGVFEALDGLKPRVKTALEEQRAEVLRSRELVRLRLESPLNPDDLLKTEMDMEKLGRLCERFALKKLAEHFGISGERLKGETSVAGPVMTERKEDKEKIFESEGPVFLAWKGEGRYPAAFRLESVFAGTREGVYADISETETEELLRKLDTKKSGPLVLWGFKELCAAEPRLRGLSSKVWDAKIAHYLLHPDKASHEAGIGKDAKGPQVCGLLADAWSGMSAEVREKGLEKVMNEIDIPLSPVLASMETYGIKVDCKHLETLREELKERIKKIQEEIDETAGTHVNLNSPKQVSWLLFDHLGYPPVRKTKTGYSTDVNVLEELASLPLGQNGLPGLLLEHREITKVLTGFVQVLLKSVDIGTGCVHTVLEHTVTGTGRLSSRDPNLQNLPTYGTWAGRVREALTPHEKGRVFVAGDYSQVELRVLAHMSGEKKLIEAFAEGRDIHSETAGWIMGNNVEDISAERRRVAKMVNFGLLYGMGQYGLAQRLGVSRQEAADLIERYFSAFPRVRAFLEGSAEEAKSKGYTQTLFGRRRPLEEVTTVEGRGNNALKRIAVNTPIQGTAADIARIAMIKLAESLEEQKGSPRLVLQVHDSLVCECDGGTARETEQMLKAVMESAVSLSVPLKVQTKSGKSFSEV